MSKTHPTHTPTDWNHTHQILKNSCFWEGMKRNEIGSSSDKGEFIFILLKIDLRNIIVTPTTIIT